MNETDNLLNVQEVAEKFRITTQTVYGLIKTDQLRAYRIGEGRSLRIPANAVNELLASHEAGRVMA
jgi:excisionase family DNA binding protein